MCHWFEIFWATLFHDLRSGFKIVVPKANPNSLPDFHLFHWLILSGVRRQLDA
jgi:hypothetical protein